MAQEQTDPDEAGSGAPTPNKFSVPLHDFLGLTFERPDEGSRHAEVRLPVHAPACGFTGALHGGAIATLVDLVCALAAARSSGFDPMRESLVTTDMHIRYLGRPRTDSVVARADVVKVGRQLIVVECKVSDEEGHVIAMADFSSMIVPRRSPMVAEADTVPGEAEL